MNPHNTFDRCCQEDAHWYHRRGFSEERFINAVIYDAKFKPYIQRQAYAERVHYYFLLAKKGISEEVAEAIWKAGIR